MNLKQQVLHILLQTETGLSPDEVPFYRGVSCAFKHLDSANTIQLQIKRIPRAATIVQPIGTPYYPGVGSDS